MSERFAIIGGAGFIGSHFTLELLSRGNSVLVIDNFSSGSEEHIKEFRKLSNFQMKQINAEDTEKVTYLLNDIDTVIHLASNPDISKAITEPRVDFLQGTVLTESVVEACRRANVKTILYASGSGVYGNAGHTVLNETSPLNPISTYGASKLAGEALLSSYSFMFGMKSISYRFANVVGSMQTHGVGYDFLQKLEKNKNSLEILGNGEQSKSYIHVTDVVSGVLTAHTKSNSINNVFNITTEDFLSVNEIASLAIEVSGLDPNAIEFKYSGGDRGWKGDVPVVRLNATKLKSLGWNAIHSSRTAMRMALNDMHNGDKN